MMAITAARVLRDGITCFVGIGLPSEAANLARASHAPSLTLIYESGTIGAKPPALPLSIGDGVLAETADAVVSVPEIFNYWLQPGRIDVGFLGAAQIDWFANINTTVIGPDYAHPAVRLAGAGGAPEIAGSCREVIVVLRQNRRAFVDRVDFVTSVGFGDGPGSRQRLGLPGAGPQKVITDLGVLEPDPATCELRLTGTYPGTLADIKAATGWTCGRRGPANRRRPPRRTGRPAPAARRHAATRGTAASAAPAASAGQTDQGNPMTTDPPTTASRLTCRLPAVLGCTCRSTPRRTGPRPCAPPSAAPPSCPRASPRSLARRWAERVTAWDADLTGGPRRRPSASGSSSPAGPRFRRAAGQTPPRDLAGQRGNCHNHRVDDHDAPLDPT
jgi:glutaconate CoA-transferase subunit B